MNMILDVNKMVFSNGSFVPVTKLNYDDHFLVPFKEGIYTFKNKYDFKTAIKVVTTIGDLYFNPNDRVLTSAGVCKAMDIKTSHYILSKILSDSSTYYLPTMNVGKYLLNGSYDVSSISPFLSKEIGVSNTFLAKALRTGVPDAEVYNERLSTYVLTQGFETVEDFKNHLLSTLVRKVPKLLSLVIVLPLLYVYLTNAYRLHNGVQILKSNPKLDLDSIRNSLTTMSVPFTETGFIFNCNSSLLENLFKDSFDSFSFLLTASPKITKPLVDFITTERFVTGSLQGLLFLQRLCSFSNVLTSIMEGEGSSYTLEVHSSDSYVTTGNFNYFAVKDVSFVKDTSNLIGIITE